MEKAITKRIEEKQEEIDEDESSDESNNINSVECEYFEHCYTLRIFINSYYPLNKIQ